MDVWDYNRRAWNEAARQGSQWSEPVGPEVIAHAREGNWEVILTPSKVVPRDWFPELKGTELLGLASGGGQQMPVFAAAGARVTSFDASEEQLSRDAMVAEREGLEIQTLQGDMADLSALPDDHFDLIFHPCSNGYSRVIRPVWKECARVLKPGGTLLAGFTNPASYLVDQEEYSKEIIHKLPYSDLTHLEKEALDRIFAEQERLEFSHTLEDQIGGQTDAGLAIIGFYEDRWEDDSFHPLNAYMPLFIATRSVKLVGPIGT